MRRAPADLSDHGPATAFTFHTPNGIAPEVGECSIPLAERTNRVRAQFAAAADVRD